MAILKESAGLSNDDIRKIRSLRPGTPLDIQLTSPTATKRARTELVGVDGTRSIIMQYPDESKWGSVREHMYVDNSIIVRAILEEETGEVIAFKVKISMLLTKPGKLIFTSFPLALQSQDLRAEKRARINLPVSVFDENGSTPIATGIIKDISHSGCRIEVPRSTLKHKLVSKQSIRMQIGDSVDSFNLTGTIMNARAEGKNNFYGTKFSQSEAAVEELLTKFLIQI